MLRHLPNTLTLLRLLAAPPIAWLIAHEQAQMALWLFLAAGLTDSIDGYLAKRFGWISRLGGWLDPLADKTLILCATAALAWHGDLPLWLFALIAMRDIVIVWGAVAFHFNYAPLRAAPTLLGKMTMLAQVLMVLLLLVANAYPAHVPMLAVQAAFVATAIFLVSSGIDYVRRWREKARRLTKEKLT